MQLWNVVQNGVILNKTPFKNQQLAFKFRKAKTNGTAAIVEVK